MMTELEFSLQATLIERNFKNAFIAMSSLQKQYDKTQYLYSSIPHPVFNCIIEAITSEANIKKTIKDIWEDYQKNNTPHCWWVSQRSQPQNLKKYLFNLGFQRGPIYRGMHGNLKKMHLEKPSMTDIHIERISHVESLNTWVKPLAESFEFSKKVSLAFVQKFKDLFLQDSPFIHYMAFYNNTLAGSATLFLDKDSAGLYNGAVFPQFRKKGILTHLATAMLLEAKNQGFEHIITHVNEACHTLSLKFGFREYLQLEAYLSPTEDMVQ